jgi:hypothetical protein
MPKIGGEPLGQNVLRVEQRHRRIRVRWGQAFAPIEHGGNAKPVLSQGRAWWRFEGSFVEKFYADGRGLFRTASKLLNESHNYFSARFLQSLASIASVSA